VLLDTSGLLSYLDAGDRFHSKAVRLFQSAQERLTHSYVLAELVALCQARGLNLGKTLPFMAELLNSPEAEIVWVQEGLHRNALALLQTRRDKSYSLCDAVGFVLMRRRKLNEALTTDHHFEQEGFLRLLK
jgi:predicted nucleic acid-binding protein